MINEYFIEKFMDSTQDILKLMANITALIEKEPYDDSGDIESLGISTSVSFIGKFKGRILVDYNKDLALKIANDINGENFSELKEKMVMYTLSEIANTIAGDAITKINNDKQASLRLAPPIIFTGEKVIISVPKIPGVSALLKTDYGKIKVNLAIEGADK